MNKEVKEQEKLNTEDTGILSNLLEKVLTNPYVQAAITKGGGLIGRKTRDLTFNIAKNLGKEKEAAQLLEGIMSVAEIGTNSGKSGDNTIMNLIGAVDDAAKRAAQSNEYYDVYQQGYLLPKEDYYALLEKEGYKRIEPTGDNPYGLVSKAVGNRNIPIFQEHEDEIERDKVIPVENKTWKNDDFADQPDLFSVGLKRARGYPSTIYLDPGTGEPYFQGWDYHNYGIDNPKDKTKRGSTATSQYNYLEQTLSNIMDEVGNPVVRKSGLRKLNPEDFKFVLNRMNAKQIHNLASQKFNSQYQDLLNSSKAEKEDKVYNQYLEKYMNLDPIDPEIQKQYPKENLKQYVNELKQNNITVEELPWLQ